MVISMGYCQCMLPAINGFNNIEDSGQDLCIFLWFIYVAYIPQNFTISYFNILLHSATVILVHLNPQLFIPVITLIQNNSYAYRAPYTAFKYYAYMIFQHFSSIVVYFRYWSGSMWENSSPISPPSFKYMLPLVSSVCKKSIEISYVAAYLSSLSSIMNENIRSWIDIDGDLVYSFWIQMHWGLSYATFYPP